MSDQSLSENVVIALEANLTTPDAIRRAVQFASAVANCVTFLAVTEPFPAIVGGAGAIWLPSGAELTKYREDCRVDAERVLSYASHEMAELKIPHTGRHFVDLPMGRALLTLAAEQKCTLAILAGDSSALDAGFLSSPGILRALRRERIAVLLI